MFGSTPSGTARPLPIGAQNAEMLDSRFTDSDDDTVQGTLLDPDGEGDGVSGGDRHQERGQGDGRATSRQRAAKLYADYSGPREKRFKWLRPHLFLDSLEDHLQSDVDALLRVLEAYGSWSPAHDAKLNSLHSSPDEGVPQPEGAGVHAIRRHRSLLWKRS